MRVRFIIGVSPRQKRFAEKVTDAIRDCLEGESGIFEVKVARTSDEANLLARDAVERSYEAIFACGDSITLNRVASALVGADASFGLVSRATSTGFARSLGIPLDIEGAVSVLKKWKTREIDVGVVAGRHFFSTAEFAFDALITKRSSKGIIRRIHHGARPAMPLFYLEYLRYRPTEVFVKTRDYTRTITPLFLSAANTESGASGLRVAPGAVPDDGLLDICMVPEKGRIKAAASMKRLTSGKIDHAKGFERIRTDSIELIKNGATLIYADGEGFEWPGAITIGVLPRRLKVIVG
jgi:diacylglycerol kinase family enzyme